MISAATKESLATLAAKIKAGIDALVADDAQQQPDPTPVDPPPPDPQPVVVLPDVEIVPFATRTIAGGQYLYPQVALDEWYDARVQYSRYQRIVRIKKATGTLAFRVTDQATGGGNPAGGFKYPAYALYIDGKEVGRWSKGTNTTGMGQMPYDVTGWKSGLYAGGKGAKFVPLDASGNVVVNPTGETYITHPEVWIDLDGTAKNDPNCVVWSGNYEFVWPDPGETNRAANPMSQAWWVIPKAALARQAAPALPALPEPQPFDTFDWTPGLTRINLTPPTDGVDLNTHIPCLTKEGYLTLANRQAYFWDSVALGEPRMPILDGPRGIATTHHSISLMPGRGWKVIGCDPWRAFRTDSAGNVRTLFGYRSKNQQYPAYYEDATLDDFELVGDWSAFIAAGLPTKIERCWAFFYDPRSTVTDPNAAPIDDEQPHPSDVISFWASENGIIIRARQAGNSHTAPVILEPWYVDPNANFWGMTYRILTNNGSMEIFVSDRNGHEILVISGDTSQTKLRSLAAAPGAKAYGSTDNSLKTWVWNDSYANQGSGVSAANLRKLFPTQAVAVEGLDWADSTKQTLVGGSLALSEARRWDADTGEFKGVACRPSFSWTNKSHYFNLAVCNGKNGPAGAIMVTSFWEQYFGADVWMPVAGRLADGAWQQRSWTSDGKTAISGKTYPVGQVVTVYDALDASNAVTGTYATKLEAQTANGTPATNSKQYVGNAAGSWQWIGYDVPDGAGNRTLPQTYPMCVGLHPDHPVIALGDSHDGIVLFRKTLPDEPVPDYAAMKAGAQVFRSKRHFLEYGSLGYRRLTAKPLPWGEDPAQDKWLTALGHKP